MKLTAPSYYDSFRCLAGACPDSCCKEWDIDIDEETAAFYRSQPGPLGELLRKSLLDTEDGTVIAVRDGRCPLWREDGLCGIQVALGEKALSHVCREFPRLTHDYGTFLEQNLELSCPEAARIILSDRECQLNSREVPGGEAGDYDQEAMDVLLRTRETALELLRNTPAPDSLILLYLYAFQAQAQLDGEEEDPFDAAAALSDARALAKKADFQELVDFFSGLEILTPRWKDLLSHPLPRRDCRTELAALARYGVLRYWLQAVSDYDLIGRVKMILVSCLLVARLGGDPVDTAHLYSKEIENDADNMDALLDAAYTHPAFVDTALLYHLLNLEQ